MVGNRLCFLCALVCALFLAAPAMAHDSWIAKGKFRSPVSGEWCCGDHDCFVVPAETVRSNGIGYELTKTAEIVPYRETLPSMDGQYWRCHRPDGSRRCFFAPPVGY
jgi:hypothetical protein